MKDRLKMATPGATLIDAEFSGCPPLEKVVLRHIFRNAGLEDFGELFIETIVRYSVAGSIAGYGGTFYLKEPHTLPDIGESLFSGRMIPVRGTLPEYGEIYFYFWRRDGLPLSLDCVSYTQTLPADIMELQAKAELFDIIF